MNEITIFWFRRDLRLADNAGLEAALRSDLPVLPLFIFDQQIIDELAPDDARISFIYEQLEKLHKSGCNLLIKKGLPLDIFKEISEKYVVRGVFCNRDYEPYARQRDEVVARWLNQRGIAFTSCKDQVIFEAGEVVKKDGDPYTVYTPYKRKWLEAAENHEPYTPVNSQAPAIKRLQVLTKHEIPTLENLGFRTSSIKVRDWSLQHLEQYEALRDFPAQDSGTYLGPHLRFGTVSIRRIVQEARAKDQTFLEELIWREFFMQILWHFPEVVSQNFKRRYDGINWLNKEEDFKKWCEGSTGYPMVDAGMRELLETGYMHNRVRMVTASFLCKHLLIDWRWGEAYFANKLLDYELSSNNGNWQWSAGTGCDAAPYFRVFNPQTQQKKFDPQHRYIKQWVPEYGTPDYPAPMVDHPFARERALTTYRAGI